MVFQLIGFVFFWCFVLYFLIKLLKGLWTCHLGYALGFGHKWNSGPDIWAIVTGATDGIGREYANELANKGYSLLLISRNEEKLENTRASILDKYDKCCNIKTLAVDFSDRNVYTKIVHEIDQLDVIEVLVNNVGMSFTYGEYFTKIPHQFIDSMINVNIISETKMMHLVLPKMEKQNRGIIINVSSVSASYPTPLLSVYSASKVYCDYISRALHFEYKTKGIIIQSVKPAFVSTKMSRLRPSLTVPKASDYVKSAIKTVGIESDTYGYWTHKLQAFVQDVVISNLMGQHCNSLLSFRKLKYLRDRYLKKYGIKE